jgi:hypothetical protein
VSARLAGLPRGRRWRAHQLAPFYRKLGVARDSDTSRNSTSPLRVPRENIVLLLHYRMAPEPALGTVPLRRLILKCAGPERVGRGVILKLGISPSAAVCEPLAILRHEINVMQGVRYQRLTRGRLILFRVPMDLRHFGAVGKRFAITGIPALYASIIAGLPRIACNQLSVMD